MKITLSELRQLVRSEVRNSGVSRRSRRLNENHETFETIEKKMETIKTYYEDDLLRTRLDTTGHLLDEVIKKLKEIYEHEYAQDSFHRSGHIY